MKYTQNHRILVVDDLADNLFLLKFTLELEGYRVELATSGEVALSIIETSPPDLVLLDVMMPDMSGFEVTQIMRQSQNLALIPIVLVTADRTVDLAQALAAGANDVIRKPIELVVYGVNSAPLFRLPAPCPCTSTERVSPLSG